MTESHVINAAFAVPGDANGGYVCGVIAAQYSSVTW
jgi:hypothetical protein